LSISSSNSEHLVSRKKFLKGVVLAGGLGAASLTFPESIIPSAHGIGTTDVAPASYVVENCSGTITAYHCITGSIDYSGSDAATVIQQAINALSSGGLIFIREGTYVLTKTILIPSYVTLTGCGSSTVLKVGNSANIDAIQNSDMTNGNTKITVRSLRIDGNKANQAPSTSFVAMGIHFTNATDSLIDSVAAENCYDRGFRYHFCKSSVIRNCVARNCGHFQEQGFTLEQSSYCQVADCYAESCRDLNYTIASGDHCRVSNCISNSPLPDSSGNGGGGI